MPLFFNQNPQANGMIPSFDFQLFQIPNFGELFANEMGVASRFNASDPAQYVDRSVERLLSLAEPRPYPTGIFSAFPQSQSGRDDSLPQITPGQADRALSEYSRRTQEAIEKALERERVENQGVNLRGIFGLPPVSKDVPTLCNDCTEEEKAELKKTGTVKSDTEKLFQIPGFGALTKGQGYLFVAIIILVLLLLFVRK